MLRRYEAFKKNASKFKIAGFRNGKVPRNVIEKMYRHFDPPYYYEGWDKIEVYYAQEEYKEYLGTASMFLSQSGTSTA